VRIPGADQLRSMLGDVAGVWNQVPEASWGVVQPGQDEMDVFRPAAPAAV